MILTSATCRLTLLIGVESWPYEGPGYGDGTRRLSCLADRWPQP